MQAHCLSDTLTHLTYEAVIIEGFVLKAYIESEVEMKDKSLQY